MSVADTILKQLGSNRFRAMTGARDFVTSPKGIRFRVLGTKNKSNMIEITLNGKDLYDIKFLKYTASRMTTNTVKAVNDVYAEDLVKVFERETGLYTSL